MNLFFSYTPTVEKLFQIFYIVKYILFLSCFFRYLIFFDIGYSQYVPFQSVNLVVNSSPNVWEDVFVDSRPFIKKYLESQDRPMVKLSKDQTVKVEYNGKFFQKRKFSYLKFFEISLGKWSLCTVLDVDCSLAHVHFETLNRKEWIYRGSTRLSPMFREEQAANTRQTGMRPRKMGPVNKSISKGD